MKKELVEKIIVKSKDTIDNFVDARKMLASARSYGTIDIMGGGLFSSILKHNRLNKFTIKLEVANADLKELFTMLPKSDVIKPDLHIGKFDLTLDIYLDNFITDGMVYYKMEECNKQICNVITWLEDVLLDYKNLYNEMFPDATNDLGHIEIPEVICPQCFEVHSMEIIQCPECGLTYTEERSPMLKIN